MTVKDIVLVTYYMTRYKTILLLCFSIFCTIFKLKIIIVKSSTVSIIVLRCNRIFLLKYSRTFLESCHLISKIICKMQLLRFILYPLATLVHTEVNFPYRLFFCRLITFCNLLVFRNLRDF